MGCEIEYLHEDQAPPTDVGTVIVHGGLVGDCSVQRIAERGPEVLWPTPGSLSNDVETAIEWAISWAQVEGVGKIYAVGVPDPLRSDDDDSQDTRLRTD